MFLWVSILPINLQVHHLHTTLLGSYQFLQCHLNISSSDRYRSKFLHGIDAIDCFYIMFIPVTINKQEIIMTQCVSHMIGHMTRSDSEIQIVLQNIFSTFFTSTGLLWYFCFHPIWRCIQQYFTEIWNTSNHTPFHSI